MRYLALDTETTGLKKNDRIIEVAIVELPSFSTGADASEATKAKPAIFHHYLNPGVGVKVHPDAFKVHGISDEFLADKPSFAAIADELVEFIRDAVLIIHNAPFDLYYLNFELGLASQRDANKDFKNVESIANKVEDTLKIAKQKFPNQSNSLDALLSRFSIDASSRDSGHGALVDTKLLCKVYECLCLNQSNLGFEANKTQAQEQGPVGQVRDLGEFLVIQPTAEELEADEKIMSKLRSASATEAS